MKDKEKTKEQIINELVEMRKRIAELESSETLYKQTEERFREINDYLENMLNYSNTPIIVWDPGFRITRFNHAFERFTGYKAEEVVSKRLHMLFPEESRDESLGKIERTLSGEFWESVEIPILLKDGDSRIALWNSANIYTEDGKTLSATIAQGIDISERRKVEEALKQSEEKLRSIFNSMTDYCYIVSKDYKIEFMNKAMIERFGDQTGKTCYKALFDRDSPCPWSKSGDIQKGETVRWEYYFPEVDYTFEIIDSPLINKDGSISKLGIWRNISERMRAEQALRESEAQYRSIFNSATDSFLIFDFDGKIVEANPQACKMYGYAYEELIKLSGKDIVHPGYYQIFKKFKRDVQTIGEFYAESVDVHKDGSTFDIEVKGSMFDYKGKPHLLAVVRDISERKRAEDELRRLKEFNEGIVQSMAEGIAVDDTEGHYTFVNPAAASMLGYTQEELLGQHWTAVTPPDQQSSIQAVNERRACGESSRYEVELVRKDGRRLSVLISGSPRFEEGRFTGTLAVFVDITERKKAEKALQQAHARYRSLFDGVPVGLYRSNPEGEILDINQTAVQMLGYPDKRALLSIKASDLYVNVEDRRQWQAMMERDKAVLGFEAQFRRYNGTTIWVRDTSRSVRDAGGRVLRYEGSLEDITEYKRAEEEKLKLEIQLLHAKRMEAIGTLAGGIAHNFNNLLMVIHGNVSLMLLDTDPTHHNYERLKKIEKQVQGGADLTRQLLGYARKGRYEVKTISLNRLVEESSNTFGIARKEISIHKELVKDLFGIKADRGQIEQVLLNLYVNAAEAMPRGGNLFLKTMNVTDSDMRAKTYKIKPGKYVLLMVTDTGVGMDKNTVERIFDPFFTTKGLSNGTGLGLASVYGIIKAHDGYIDVDSEKGHGTTFNIYLPASEEEIEEEKKPYVKLLKGKETVLLVDDEDMLIDVGRKMLSALGYKVLVARNGKEAIEIIKGKEPHTPGAKSSALDLVILDMIMPDMGGGETYDRIKEINPDIKVLLSSGYSINGQAAEILERGCDAFIQKPFDMKQLSQRIREILDKK